MAKDERYHKQQQQNRFYLALKHHYHDQFESILEPHEQALWASIPVFHQAFIQQIRDWEWLAKQSIELLHGDSINAEAARGNWYLYQRLAKHPKPVLPLSDLAILLHPLHYLPDDFLWQCVDEAMNEQLSIIIPYEPNNSIDSRLKLLNHIVSLEWLQAQPFDHLKHCAQVWNSYLTLDQSAPESKPVVIQGNPDQQIELIQSALVERVNKEGLSLMALPRGFKADFKQWFCSKYPITTFVFDKRWQELMKAGFLDTSFKPNRSKK